MCNTVFRINQVGYITSLPKFVGVLRAGTVTVTDGEGHPVSQLQVDTPAYDAASGDRVTLIDLGDLPAGKYILSMDGESRSITVFDRPYSDLLHGLIKGLYYQRCGSALLPEHAGVWTHSACHTAPARLYTDPDVRMNVQGGWHDAGDYGKYVGPGAITVAHLLYTYLIFPGASITDLNIPESGNGIPDLLNEARYELQWMLKMQRADGAVYHKLTKKHFAPFIMPEQDTETEFVMPVGQCATAAFAACMALASRVWKNIDPDFSDKTLQAAISAWNWLEKNPTLIPWKNPDDVHTGGYGDNNMTDELFWAGCELYAATGDPAYFEDVEFNARQIDISQMGWRETGGLGAVCCLFTIRTFPDPEFSVWLKERFLRAAGRILSTAEQSRYGTALATTDYIWGSNLLVLSRGMVLACAWMLTGDRQYLVCAQKQLNYLMGLNTLDVSFVTGFGEKPFMNPHHRPSGSDGIVDPVPGLVSGGPNNRFTYAATKERFPEGTPPARSWLDELPSADTNEVAIYWNSPAVFLTACLDSQI